MLFLLNFLQLLVLFFNNCLTRPPAEKVLRCLEAMKTLTLPMYFFNLFVALMENNYNSFVLQSRSMETPTGNQYVIARRRLQAITEKINLID